MPSARSLHTKYRANELTARHCDSATPGARRDGSASFQARTLTPFHRRCRARDGRRHDAHAEMPPRFQPTPPIFAAATASGRARFQEDDVYFITRKLDATLHDAVLTMPERRAGLFYIRASHGPPRHAGDDSSTARAPTSTPLAARGITGVMKAPMNTKGQVFSSIADIPRAGFLAQADLRCSFTLAALKMTQDEFAP